jgi:protoporphyrin/coproporphyrin ferrochelatase
MSTGVLLAQLGTPDAPTTPAVRRYLREFLSDRRVVDLNPWIWKPILHGIILRTRPKRSAALYRRVWTEAGSPLLVHTQAQARGLAQRLEGSHRVGFGMRIGNPSIARGLDELVAEGCTRIGILPLFPQFSSATTSSVQDAVEAWSRKHPAVETDLVCSFCDDAGWIAALRERVVASGFVPSRTAPLLMSFHGIPQRFADRGDPYDRECRRTAVALAEALALEDDAWRMVFQSRFGREAWLQPYTDEILARLPREGITSVAVITPSFVSDCLETIDEIGRESRRVFEEAGGVTYARIECVNASEAFLDALAGIVRERL